MDTRVDASLLVKQRTSRAWSQQQLAEIAGVSLRTIQRIEKTGVASQDSVKALSSAFGEEPALFLLLEDKKRKTTRLSLAASLISVLSVLLGWLYLSRATAEPIELNIEYRSEILGSQDVNEASWRYVVEAGKTAVLDLPNGFSLSLLPHQNETNTILEAMLVGETNQEPTAKRDTPRVAGDLKQGLSLRYEKLGEAKVTIRVQAAK